MRGPGRGRQCEGRAVTRASAQSQRETRPEVSVRARSWGLQVRAWEGGFFYPPRSILISLASFADTCLPRRPPCSPAGRGHSHPSPLTEAQPSAAGRDGPILLAPPHL